MSTRIVGRLRRSWLPVAIVTAFTLAPQTDSAGKPNPPTPPPSPPSGLTATAVSASQINLAWSDNSSNETGFKIVRTNPDSTTTTFTTEPDAVAYQDTGLSPISTYSYSVWSTTNRAGDSASCAGPALATTLNLPPPPGAVTFETVDIGGGSMAAMNAAGTIVGTADLPIVGEDGLPTVGSTGFVLEPVNRNGKLVWFEDISPEDGFNDLMKPLKGMSGLGVEATPGATSASDINADGTIVGTQWYSVKGTEDEYDYWDSYEAVVLWARNADGTYGEPVKVAKFCSDARPGINDAGCVVGIAWSPYLYDVEEKDTLSGLWAANLPFIIAPRDVDGDGGLEWFQEDPVEDHYGRNALMFKMAGHYYLDDGIAVTNDNTVIMNGTGLVRPDYRLPNPWFIDTSVPPDGRNDLPIPFPAGSWATATSPNGRIASGIAGNMAVLIDLAAPVPTCASLGVPPGSEGTEAWDVNDAEWVVGASYIIETFGPPGRGNYHVHYRVYSALFWKAGTMWPFSALLTNTAVTAPEPHFINNSGIVAGTATSASGQPTLFVAIPSVSP